MEFIYWIAVQYQWGQDIQQSSPLLQRTLPSVLWLLSYETEEHFSHLSLICSSNSVFLTEHKWQGPHVSLLSDTIHLCRTPSDRSDTAPSVRVHSAYVHIHFLLITSLSCLWLLPDIVLGPLISEYIINNLHVISFVLIIFVWRNVSLHGECWGYLPHLGAQGTPCSVCYVALCD